MKKYTIELSRNECSNIHPLKIIINLTDGPPQRQSINASYHGKILPLPLKMLDDFFTCPETGKHTTQGDDKKIFLVPVSK